MKKLVVVGQGYVGLPLAVEAARAGYRVTGLDNSKSVVESLRQGRSHIGDISNDVVQEILELGYSASTDPTVLKSADVIVVCVPTPLTAESQPDLSALKATIQDCKAHLQKGATLILESTTYPGTTNDYVLPELELTGRKLDSDFFLAFSPERIDPGNKHYNLTNTPKIVGGASEKSAQKATDFYSAFIAEVVNVRSSIEAETAKLLENTYRHINIALVNEMAIFCHELGIDLWDVIHAAATKPFGFQAFYPGPGVGGHCIPIDPSYLAYEVSRKLGHPFRFVQLAEEVNKSMPRYVARRVQDLLNENGKPLKGATILLLGVAYKGDIADTRESPAYSIYRELTAKGARVLYNDPFVPAWSVDGNELTSSSLAQELPDADVTVLLQRHSRYDVEELASKAKLFFDTRGVTHLQGAVRL